MANNVPHDMANNVPHDVPHAIESTPSSALLMETARIRRSLPLILAGALSTAGCMPGKKIHTSPPDANGVAVQTIDYRSFYLDDFQRHVQDGKPLYRERYEAVEPFDETGAAVAKDSNGFFHIDTDGEPLYPERFIELGSFDPVHHLAVAADFLPEDSGLVREPRYFHINRQGKRIYLQDYNHVEPFTPAGIAVVQDIGFSPNFHHIDSNGTDLYNERFGTVYDFNSKGLALAQNADGILDCFIDRKGQIVPGTCYENTRLCDNQPEGEKKWCSLINREIFELNELGYPVIDQDGMEIVPTVGNQEFKIASYAGRQFHLDSDGAPLYEMRFDHVEPFDTTGKALVKLRGYYFYIYENGNRVSGHTYDAVDTSLAPGIDIAIKTENDKKVYFILRPNGEPKHSLGYDSIIGFSDGIGIAVLDGKQFHISASDGQPLYEARYDRVTQFEGDSAIATLDGKQFHISASDGQPLYAARYDRVTQFEGDSAIATLDGTKFHIGMDGLPLYDNKYHDVHSFNSSGVAQVQTSQGTFHFIDKSGSRVSSFYVCVSPFEDRIAVAELFVSEDQCRGEECSSGPQFVHISENGKPLYEKRYSYISQFDSNDIAVAQDRAGNYFYMGKNGKASFPGRYLYAQPFDQGTAKVHTIEGMFYINLEGERVTLP